MRDVYIQLPDDVKIISQRMMPNYQIETVYWSNSCNFTGTEQDFVADGYGYKYIQINKFERRLVA